MLAHLTEDESGVVVLGFNLFGYGGDAFFGELSDSCLMGELVFSEKQVQCERVSCGCGNIRYSAPRDWAYSLMGKVL